jgi:hypothetical protein
MVDSMSKILKLVADEEIDESFINVEPAVKFIPEWYRTSNGNIPGSFTELVLGNPGSTTSTYKKCTPFLDALTAGYIVFLTADVEVVTRPDGEPYIHTKSQRIIVTDHSKDQWNGLLCPDGYGQVLLKWHSQISFNTPQGYSLLFINPMNRFDLPFQTVNGIVDTDIYNLPIHFPFFVRKNFVGIIPKGTPICQIIPIKRETWQREKEMFDHKKTKTKYEKFFSTIKRSYKTNYWTRKEYK